MPFNIVKKKRPFLLLEALIAFALVVLCAVPLMQSPIKAYRSHLGELENLECDRIANYSFSEIKILLLENDISWESISEKISKAPHYSLAPPFEVQTPNCYSKKVFRSYQIWVEKEKEGPRGEIYRRLGLRITLTLESQTAKSKSLKYNFWLFTQKLPHRQIL